MIVWRQFRNTSYLVCEDGRVIRKFETKPDKLVKPWSSGRYMNVSISMANKKRHFLLHRMVAECFLSPVGGKPCINHKDHNPLNNHYTNLEWVTQGENIAHAVAAKRHCHGEKHGNARLTNKQVLDIKRRYIRGINQNIPGNAAILAKEYGIRVAQVRQLAVTWRHLKP